VAAWSLLHHCCCCVVLHCCVGIVAWALLRGHHCMVIVAWTSLHGCHCVGIIAWAPLCGCCCMGIIAWALLHGHHCCCCVVLHDCMVVVVYLIDCAWLCHLCGMWLHCHQCNIVVVVSCGVVASLHGVVALLPHCVIIIVLFFLTFLILSFSWVICCFVSLHCDLWFVVCYVCDVLCMCSVLSGTDCLISETSLVAISFLEETAL